MALDEDRREKWYYDACALEHESVWVTVIEKTHQKRIIISHLSIGEAYGNALSKDRGVGDKQRVEGFEGLAASVIMKFENVEIVDNEAIEKILAVTREHFPELKMADSIHLATAIREQCCKFVTTDHDLLGIQPEKWKKFLKAVGVGTFLIASPLKKR